MNTWALTPEFMNVLEEQFTGFLNNLSNPLKDEYLLPTIIGNLLDEKKATVKVLETKDKWFGVTYKEDKQTVVDSFKHLIETGVYKEDLYSDL